jgi:hypothetical protein
MMDIIIYILAVIGAIHVLTYIVFWRAWRDGIVSGIEQYKRAVKQKKGWSNFQ